MVRNFLHLTKEGERYMREIRELESSCVKVGFQAGVDPYEDGTQLPDVAAYNEFGGSTRPARPFMKQSFANNEDKLQAACNRAQRIIYDGGTAEDALKKLGVALKGIVQNEIREGEFAPNAPSTIARKKSAQPLIDSAHMRQSVNFIIVKEV